MSFKLSKSAVNCFINCPRKFKYQYVDNIESESNEFAELGTNVHQIAEDFIKSDALEKNKDILAVLKEFESKYEDDYSDHCENLAKFFKDMFVEKGYKLFIAEEYLFSEIHNFSGYADLVLEDKEGKLFVIDYKTGKARDVNKYKLELCYYKMLIEEQYPGKIVSKAGIYFTKEGVLSALEFSDEDSTDTICSIKDYNLSVRFIDTVRLEIDAGEFPPRRQRLCGYCSYMEQCMEDSGFNDDELDLSPNVSMEDSGFNDGELDLSPNVEEDDKSGS